MTKKQLNAIVDTLVRMTLVDKVTASQPDTYEPTKDDEDQARTLVGMTLRAKSKELLAAVPSVATVEKTA